MQLKVTVFEFTSYKFEPDKKKVFFNYKTEFKGAKPLFFTEIIIMPKLPDIKSLEKGLIRKLLESLHLILGISYYKLYCATKIKLPYDLSKKEADFWNMVYQKGLGEFFYRNNLDPQISPKFPFARNKKTVSYSLEKNNRCLVAIGGGRDSLVSAELLKENNFDITSFFVRTNSSSPLIEKILKKIGQDSLKIERVLDTQLQLPHQYAGHIPISAIYAFLGVFAAVFYKYSYFVVSNEYSSNFGNLKYRGQIVNHQWSKSFEFERLFQDYVSDFISTDLHYFSLLRGFYEIRIARMFSKFKKYFPYFSSCNQNFKINSSLIGANKGLEKKLWCNNCPKCVFGFTLLSAFLSKKDLMDIFKKNLYQDKNLLPLFKDILGFGKTKPFDCVGTFEEARVALYLAGKKSFKQDFIVRQILPKIKIGPVKIKEVFSYKKDSSIPEKFKFLGLEKVLILGYGREGKITKKYLKKYYPKLKIGIADIKQGKNYLEKEKNFDIAIKTPGIRKKLLTIPYTTASNIFFAEVLGKNKIIGITGSKGKSTTSSLIFAILKEAGKQVKLLGNIGDPMLEALLSPIKKDTIFVLELSSAQLEDLKLSPDIAAVTNLFPEHMDYHSTVENYYNAKKNIINFQNRDNYFVYDPKNEVTAGWFKNYKGKAMPFSKNIPLKNSEIPLIGQHNKNNIKAAISVAKILGIPDRVIKNVVKNFKPLPHRLEFAGEFKGIKFYNDGSSTNPESAILAIKSLRNIDTIFLGGENRGYDFSDLEKTLRKYKIRNIVLFPDSGEKILKSKKNFITLKTSSMKKAVEFAYNNTKKGGICLLSGASPSYSLWKNFEEKGSQFKYFIRKLGKTTRS